VSHNPATLAIIGVVVAVIVIAGALATTGFLSPSSSSQSVTSSLPSTISSTTISSSSNQSIPPIPAPTHGWINTTWVDTAGRPYPPIMFGAYSSDNTSNIAPSTWVGNLTENAPYSVLGIYKTVTISANTFVSESFVINQSIFFNSVDMPVSYAVTQSPNIAVSVYLNGQTIANYSRILNIPSATPSNTPIYSTNNYGFLHTLQIPAGSVVTIGFVANETVGIFPLQNIPGNASAISGVTSIPLSLSELPNSASTLPVFLTIGLEI
jgi:hypothetical protein